MSEPASFRRKKRESIKGKVYSSFIFLVYCCLYFHCDYFYQQYKRNNNKRGKEGGGGGGARRRGMKESVSVLLMIGNFPQL